MKEEITILPKILTFNILGMFTCGRLERKASSNHKYTCVLTDSSATLSITL